MRITPRQHYAKDRVTQVLSNGVPVASNITYKPFGGMTTALSYGNGIQRTVSYDQNTGWQASPMQKSTAC